MANGVAVANLVPPSANPSTGTQEGIKAAIGEAVASAAAGLCQGIMEYQNGGLRPETRTVNGERVAAPYWLQQGHASEIDFPAVARVEGKRVLRTYLDTDFRRLHGPDAGEWTLNMLVDAVLEVVGRVTAAERALMS